MRESLVNDCVGLLSRRDGCAACNEQGQAWSGSIRAPDARQRYRLGAVGMGAVVDLDDDDGVVGVVDAHQDAVVAAPGAVEAFEVVA